MHIFIIFEKKKFLQLVFGTVQLQKSECAPLGCAQFFRSFVIFLSLSLFLFLALPLSLSVFILAGTSKCVSFFSLHLLWLFIYLICCVFCSCCCFLCRKITRYFAISIYFVSFCISPLPSVPWLFLLLLHLFCTVFICCTFILRFNVNCVAGTTTSALQ